MGALNDLSESALRTALEWAYERALEPGVPVVESVDDLAEAYTRNATSLRACAESLVKWQAGKTAAAGFVTAFGGFASLPISLTVDLAATYFIQLRMVAAIAAISGLLPRNVEVREHCIRCVADHLFTSEEALGTSVLTRLAGKRWLARMKRLPVRRVGRVLPLVGGVINGAMNGALTLAIGKRAMERFLPNEP